MANKLVRWYAKDRTPIDVLLVENADGSHSLATADGGPVQALTRGYYTSDDCHLVPIDISVAPLAGKKVVAMDIVVSVDTDCEGTVLMETSGNILASGFLPAKSGFQCLTLRGMLKADAADKKIQLKTDVAAKVRVTTIQFSQA